MALRVSTTGMSLGQGLVFLGSGLWPVVHQGSFEKVTGPKPEGWLVKTVGLLVAVVGTALLSSGVRRREPTPELAVVAAGSAAALAAIDLWYGGVRRRISPVYLLDAALELGFVAGWGLAALARRRARRAAFRAAIPVALGAR